MEQTDKEVVPTTAEQEAFSKQYHWFYGLDEYFEFTGKSERWQVLKKAVLQQNWYRIRDVIIELATMPNSNPAHARAWINALLREKVSAEVKPQMMATLVRKYMHEDAFMVNICQFVNYWAKDDAAADMPDMNDFLSRGQVRSKLWLISELAKVVEGPIGNVFLCAGWYATLATMLFESSITVDKIRSFDIDDTCRDIAETFNKPWVKDNWKFKSSTKDIMDINYEFERYEVIRADGTTCPLDDTPDTIINTSCEHIENFAEWYDKIPAGKLVILQSNNFFEVDEHVNCSIDIDDFSRQTPLKCNIRRRVRHRTIQ